MFFCSLNDADSTVMIYKPIYAQLFTERVVILKNWLTLAVLAYFVAVRFGICGIGKR